MHRARGKADAVVSVRRRGAPALFVGRQEELQRFAAATKQVRLVLVYGVGGVGKTSLLLRGAEEIVARTGGRLAYHICQPKESVATVAAGVLEQLDHGDRRRAGDPIEILAREAAEAPLVICLDDVHRAEDGCLVEAIVHLAARRLPLWFCLASRQALPISPTAVDHLVQQLRGLPPDDARTLWSALQELYGPAASSFEEVVGNGGNPLQIKQAFARRASAELTDPMGIEALPSNEAALLTELCTFRHPIPFDALAFAKDREQVKAAVDALSRRFLVEVSEHLVVSIHDVVREATQRSIAAPTRQSHARALRYYEELQGSQRHDGGIRLEMLHHAVGSGEQGKARSILMHYAGQLGPAGAVVEHQLAQELDAIAVAAPLPIALKLLRERIRARQGQSVQAFAEVERLAVEDEPAVDLCLGEIAYCVGRLHEAVPRLERVAMNPTCDFLSRVWATVNLIEVLRSLGDIDRVHHALAALDALVEGSGPLGDALRSWIIGGLKHDWEEHQAAADALATARRAIGGLAALAPALPLLSSLEQAAAAAAGRPSASDQGEAFEETVYFRLAARALNAEQLLYRGEARAAASLSEATAKAAADGGYRALHAWTTAQWAEAERMLGRFSSHAASLQSATASCEAGGLERSWLRVRVALARLQLTKGQLADARTVALETLRRTRCAVGTAARLRAIAALADAAEGDAKSAHSRMRSAGRAEGFDRAEFRLASVEVLLWSGLLAKAQKEARQIESEATAAGWQHLACRARLFGAEAAYRRGCFAEAAAALESASATCEQKGYAAEGLFAELLAAALARTDGDLESCARRLTRVAERAHQQGFVLEADAARVALAVLSGQPTQERSLGQGLARRLTLASAVTCRVRDESSVRWLVAEQVESLDDDRYELFVDLVNRRVTVGARSVTFLSRDALGDLIRVLATSPGRIVSLRTLMRQVWGLEYHPLRHRHRIAKAISRLRTLIGERAIFGARGEGYGLVTRAGWAVVEPLDASAVPLPTCA